MNDIEKQYVYDVYNEISDEFSSTRQYPWPTVKSFIKSLQPFSLVCDVGSGNGKNMFRNDLIFTATDISEQMCNLSITKTPHTIQSNVLHLPFKDNTFDSVICIACIHHLNTHERRYNAIKECLRILKPEGKILISLWANSDKYGNGDQFIKWNRNRTKRFYHLYSEAEVKNICKDFNLIHSFDKHNYYLTN